MRKPLSKRTFLGHLVLPLLTGLYLTLFPFNTPLMVDNSQSYLDFSHLHSLGYPLFLNLIHLFSDETSSVIHAQVAFFCFALMCLSLSVRRISENSWLALLCVVPIAANVFILSYHFSIQPFSLFISLGLIMMAAVLFSFGQGRFRSLFCFGLIVGLCITIVDFGWAYFGLIFFVAPIVAQQRFCSFMKAFLLPIMVVVLLVVLETGGYFALHDNERENTFASNLFARTALMDSEQSSPYANQDPRTHIWTMIEENLQTQRQKIWQLDDFTAMENLLTQSEERFKQDFAQKEFQFAQTTLERPVEDIKMDMASSRIIQDPLAFIEICLVHYRGLWQSDEPVVLGFWIFSLGVVAISLWFLITGQQFNPALAGSFISALAVQFNCLWVAISGLGPDNIVVLSSPLLTLSVCCLITGIYTSLINPLHTYD